MSRVAVPSNEDIVTAAEDRYAARRQKAMHRRPEDSAPPTWDELCDAERSDEINQMRAAAAAGPRVAERLGLRVYSLTIDVPEVGQTVLHKGWPAIVTMTRDSAADYSEPFQAQAALPSLRDELSVHLHIMSALGPYPAYAVGHGPDGWQWPQEARDQLRAEQERTAARELRESEGASGRSA